MKAILERKSIRKYTNQPVPKEAITDLLKAAMAAPSAGNEQPWFFIVIDDKEIMRSITQVHPYSQMLPQAQYAIVVCGDPKLEKYKGFWVQDCSAACENILIAAQDMGLGSVWLGVHPIPERTKAIQYILGLPEDIIPLSILPIGYPAEKRETTSRYNEGRIKYNKW